MRIRKAFLQIVIGCVSISALASIICLLRGTWRDLDFRVIFTSLLVAAGSILSMGCGAAWETRRNPVLAAAGFAATAFATVVSLLMLWDVMSGSNPWGKAVAVGWIAAVACAHASLLSLARLTGRALGVAVLAQVSVMTLAGQFIQLVLTDALPHPPWHAIGINAVVVAAASVLVPILHQMSPSPAEPVETGTEAAHVTCPRCGQSRRAALGRQTCERCGQGFRIELA